MIHLDGDLRRVACGDEWRLRLLTAGADGLDPRGTLVVEARRSALTRVGKELWPGAALLRDLVLELLPPGAALGLVLREVLCPEGEGPPHVLIEVLP